MHKKHDDKKAMEHPNPFAKVAEKMVEEKEPKRGHRGDSHHTMGRHKNPRGMH